VDGTPERRERVLLLSKGLGRGGAERLLVGAARGYDRARVDVEVAYLLPWKDAFVDELEVLGVPVFCLGARGDLDPRWVWRLWRLLRARRYDIVHVQMPVPAVAVRLMRRRGTPKVVYTEHNLWSRYRPLTRWANALTYRRNDAVIAVSDAVAASIRPPGRSAPAVEVIVHGPDLDAIPTGAAARAHARAALGLPESALVVGSVGNFTPKKDHATMLDAVARVSSTAPVVLALAGIGPLEAELRAHAARRGLGDRVRFLGMRDDVYELLAGFDVFAMSSRFEGLPIALLEAMSAGVPPVATAVGGIPEVVRTGQEGLLVPPADATALADALQRLLDHPELRREMGAAARERAAAFDLAGAVRSTEHVYDRVMGRAS
jgi:glycosyltransferase involved in cell wall biosynthesis